MANSVFIDQFASFCISGDANAFGTGTSIIIEGQYIPNPLLANPIVPDKPVRVEAERFVDQMFTAGSVLANMLHTIFCANRRGLDITVIPRLDPVGSVKAVYEWPITGPATTAGYVTIYAGEAKWNVIAKVSAGDTAAQIAAAVVAAYATAKLDSFPYVVTANGATLVYTAKNGGTVGNYLVPVYNWQGRHDYAPAGVAFGTVARTTTGAGNPAPVDYEATLGTCCFYVFGLATEDPVWHEALRAYLDTRHDCSRPQCFGVGYVYTAGTLGQVLATWDNQRVLPALARPLNALSLPYLDIANMLALRASAKANPELSIQGPDNGLLSCVKVPAGCGTEWSEPEMAALSEKGFQYLIPARGGNGALTAQFVVADTTRYLYDEQGRNNWSFRDTNSLFLDAAFAEKVAGWLRKWNGYALIVGNARPMPGVKAVGLNIIQADIEDELKREVGLSISAFDEVAIVTDETLLGACFGEPGLLHINIETKRLVRLKGFRGTIVPKMYDNCDTR
jgi:hypothetical protein